MLLREFEGDFALRFHVAGAVAPAPQGREREAFTTGMVLLDGNKLVVDLLSYPVNKRPSFILIERRGDRAYSNSSWDGVTWPRKPQGYSAAIASKKLKLAIIASSDGAGVFKAEFDQLQIRGGGATK